MLAASGWRIDAALAAAMHAVSAAVVPDHPVRIVASNATALAATAAAATAAGWRVVGIGDDLTGEARDVGATHAARALAHAARGERVLLLSGGELTVTVRDKGGNGGGPALEYLAGMIAALPDGAPVSALAGDSDGIDRTMAIRRLVRLGAGAARAARCCRGARRQCHPCAVRTAGRAGHDRADTHQCK